MRKPFLLLSLSLAVLLSGPVLAQDPVEIQFQTDPVLVQTGTEMVFTVLTVPEVFSMAWQYQGGVTVGQWTGGNPVVNTGTQFQGRVTISSTQLRIGGAQLRDAGNYTVEVTPAGTTGLDSNSRSIRARVFDAVSGVTLLIPSVAVEGRNVSLRCTWTGGTEVTVQWGKGDVAVVTDGRITVSGGSLVINPARRGDAGDYTCTVSNPVSAQTASQSLTVYYGPDTPVLTNDAPKECVGGGDVLVGQTVRLTCLSDSLPPALFTWQRDGQTVASGQPDSGVLSVQTFSTEESGRYVCTARNAITEGSADQGTDLAVVDTCLNVGEVVGIVIGCLLLIVIIVLLIVLIVFLARRRRAEQRHSDTTVLVQKTNPNPIPPVPQPNGARDLGQGPLPPLYQSNGRQRVYDAPREGRSDPRTLLPNGLRDSDRRRNDGRVHANGQPHNGDSYPRNGIDNRGFTQTNAQQQQNPNILIQAGGGGRGGAQTPTVHVNLNTLPQAAQQNNNNAHMPTIHVNLNSYPNTGQQEDGSSAPVTNNNASQQNATQTGQLNPRMQSGRSQRSDEHLVDPPALVPTGYTHFNASNQRNANTQTYQPEPEPEPERRSERNSWDLLRGTPAYPSGTRRLSSSDSTDYTENPPIRTPNRSRSRPPSQSTSRSRRDEPSLDRRTRSRSADPEGPSAVVDRHIQKSTRREIRGSPAGQAAPRQGAAHNNNNNNNPPRAMPPMSRFELPQAAAPRASDSRALADPNHLPQAAQQHRAAPQGQTGTLGGAGRPRQGGGAPAPVPSAQRPLTQAALSVHTERSQTFQNRRQQTQAALLHPGPTQARVPAAAAAVAQVAPTPPPAIPLAQFQALPKKQQRSPTRGPQPPRPPVNMPVAQRQQHVQHRTTNHQHHHHHTHGTAHRNAHGHRRPPHATHPPQQHPTHGGRPR